MMNRCATSGKRRFSKSSEVSIAIDPRLNEVEYFDQPLNMMAIDNLPSLLPIESSEDYAAQLLPSPRTLDKL
jgi:hypothetical protein